MMHIADQSCLLDVYNVPGITMTHVWLAYESTLRLLSPVKYQARQQRWAATESRLVLRMTVAILVLLELPTSGPVNSHMCAQL